MSELADYQHAFAAALLDAAPSAHADVQALQRQPGFAVYRNTVLRGCIDALAANFPTVRQLVGDEWLQAAAAEYVRLTLPRTPSLLDYGHDFAAFLAVFEPARALPYLAAVAHADRCWTEAHGAADATPLAPAWLATQPLEALAGMVLAPHPAARWLWCDEVPVHALWTGHRATVPFDGSAVQWRSEGLLLTRPHDAVLGAPLGTGGVAFLDTCAAGAPLAVAAAAASSVDPGLDLAALMHDLLVAGALCAPA